MFCSNWVGEAEAVLGGGGGGGRVMVRFLVEVILHLSLSNAGSFFIQSLS